MCSLCGVLGGRGHWADRSSNPDALQTRAPTTLAGERQQRTQLINRVLKYYGLSLTDWPPNAFILKSHTGKIELVNNLTELWAAAETITKKDCDPLAPELLAGLEQR